MVGDLVLPVDNSKLNPEHQLELAWITRAVNSAEGGGWGDIGRRSVQDRMVQ
jgi:hypothetical protein